MKKLKKILKWMGIILLILIGGIGATVMTRQNMKYNAIYPDIHSSKDPAVIARGKHLVFSTAHCINCHSKGNPDSLVDLGQDPALSGGVLFDLPVGKIYSKNITPDRETGIGKFSDREIARALRYGVHPDGTVVYDFMPFHNTSDEDLTAIISYLRTQQPVKNQIPKNELNTLGKVVKAFVIKPVGPTGEVEPIVPRDSTAEYGKYLALHVSECNGCHTKRDITGKFIGEPFGGGGLIEGFLTPNLSPDSTGRIFSWSKKQFIDRFRLGKQIPTSPMPWNSFKHMTDEELTAIYHYLKSIKPVRNAK